MIVTTCPVLQLLLGFDDELRCYTCIKVLLTAPYKHCNYDVTHARAHAYVRQTMGHAH